MIEAFSDVVVLPPQSSKNVVFEKLKQQPAPQSLAAQRRLVGDHYLAGGTIESDIEVQ